MIDLKPMRRGAWIILGGWLFNGALQAMNIENLQCESLRNPQGLEASKVPLSWALASPLREDTQSVWRILVASCPEKRDLDQGDLWESGKLDDALEEVEGKCEVLPFLPRRHGR